ncbi:MAG: PilX N-terminal domain-containing pilus assembly protein, partial [Venatoribacter sp.]
MALIVSLIILTIITLGSVVAMQRANTQSKMIGNLQHKQALFTTGQNEINFMLEQLKEDDIR